MRVAKGSTRAFRSSDVWVARGVDQFVVVHCMGAGDVMYMVYRKFPFGVAMSDGGSASNVDEVGRRVGMTLSEEPFDCPMAIARKLGWLGL